MPIGYGRLLFIAVWFHYGAVPVGVQGESAGFGLSLLHDPVKTPYKSKTDFD
jgi:hypothetical protein